MSKTSSPSSYELDIRFEDVSEHLLRSARKISGLVRLKHIGKLIEVLDLDANPRNSAVGPVTRAILETLEMSPDLYPLKSNGLLLGCSQIELLEGKDRYGLTFENKRLEGVLDGGHNLLAIGIFLLEKALEDPKHKKELAKIKNWAEFKDVQIKHFELFDRYLSSGQEDLQIKVKVELIVPPSDDSVAIERFEGVLLEIQEARNNNAQLSQSTKTNQAGFFEELKRFTDPEIAKKIEWKENDGGSIKAADLVALAWIPLSALEFFPKTADGKNIVPPAPVALYAQKATCVSRFNDFMECDEVTSKTGAKISLDSIPVRSALRLAGDMPRLHDFIAGRLPGSYNRTGARYGRILAVANLNKAAKQPKTKYTEQFIEKKSPDGFIAPLVYSLRAIIRKNDDGTVEWALDPYSFLNQYLDVIVDNLREFILEPGDDESADPQKIGKNASVYRSCLQAAQLAFVTARADSSY